MLYIADATSMKNQPKHNIKVLSNRYKKYYKLMDGLRKVPQSKRRAISPFLSSISSQANHTFCTNLAAPSLKAFDRIAHLLFSSSASVFGS